MPIMSRWAPSCQVPPCSSTNDMRTSSQTASESTSRPSRSKTTAAISGRDKSGLGDRDHQLAALDRRPLASSVRRVVDRRRQGLPRDVPLALARGREQLLIAAEAEGDSIGDLEPGLLARLLDGPDPLPREPLPAQRVVEVELEGDGMTGLRLDLVALERLHHEVDVVGREGVLLAFDRD